MTWIKQLVCFGLGMYSVVSGQSHIQRIYGRWFQLYNNLYVQSTSEIDLQCVSVEVKATPSLSLTSLSVTKKAIQHHNQNHSIVWGHHYNVTMVDKEKTSLDDNVVLFPVPNDSYVVVPLYLRRFQEDEYVIWTGLDNKTMYVWVRDTDQVDNVVILEQLKELEFTTTYKSPALSFTPNCSA